MNSFFDITVMCIPTKTAHEWLKRLSEFLSEEIKDGAWVRGWPELSFWLLNAFRETPPVMEFPKSCIDRLESTARILNHDVVEQMIERGMTHLYRVNKQNELLAFFLTSWDNDNFSLILFPASCSHDDEAAIISTVDNLGIKSYPTLDVSASWFVTVNMEGIDDSFVCFASKNLERMESLRQNFGDQILSEDAFEKYNIQ